MNSQLAAQISFGTTSMMLTFATLLALTSSVVAQQASQGSQPNNHDAIEVQVLTPESDPLPRTTVVCIGSSTNAVLKGTSVIGGTQFLQTDSAGWFNLRPSKENLFLVIANEAWFGLSQSSDLTNHPTMVVRPWGRVEGIRLNRGHPVANQRLTYGFEWRSISSLDDIRDRLFTTRNEAVTDSSGRFVFEHVPPGLIQFWEAHRHPIQAVVRLLPLLEVKPGQTNRIEIATQGRTVVGQLSLGEGLESNLDLSSCFGGLSLEADWAHINEPWPPDTIDDIEKRTKWLQDWFKTDIGQKNLRAFSAGTVFEFHSNGSFIGEMVEPGKYWVNGSIERNGERLASLEEVHFELPATQPGHEEDVFNIGKVALRPVVHLKPKDPAPDFTVKTLDDQSLRLSDFRGKYVLLDFWATWCGPCVAEMPNLKQTYEVFGKHPQFVMISLSLDQDKEEPKKFTRSKGVAWPQVFLGDWSKDAVTQKYGVYAIPQIILIGPDGKILSNDLRGAQIKKAVARALGKGAA